jgi:ribosome biogenesis protein Nip4
MNEFAVRLGATIRLDDSLVVERRNRYFLLSEDLKKVFSEDFFYAGIYLGKVKGSVFFPSFNLLRMITKGEANKVTVDEKTEWLFICGRDIFKQGIMKVSGSKKKGDLALILNLHDESLGFGKILHDLEKERKGLAIKNILDIGDFLRRER